MREHHYLSLLRSNALSHGRILHRQYLQLPNASLCSLRLRWASWEALTLSGPGALQVPHAASANNAKTRPPLDIHPFHGRQECSGSNFSKLCSDQFAPIFGPRTLTTGPHWQRPRCFAATPSGGLGRQEGRSTRGREPKSRVEARVGHYSPAGLCSKVWYGKPWTQRSWRSSSWYRL
jgi:hypothetical protein